MTELYIGDNKLDLLDNTAVALTRQVNDIASMQDRQADYTNRFNLPKTANNVKLLGVVTSINSDSDIPYAKTGFKIITDGVELVNDGFGVIDAVNNNIEVTIYSGNADFFEAISEKSIRDLDLSAYRLQWTRALVISNRTNTSGALWPIINRGVFNNSAYIDVRSLWPAIYAHTIISAIFSDAGFTKTGDILTDDWYTKLVMPYDTIRVDDAVITKVSAFKQCLEQSWSYNTNGWKFERVAINSDVDKVDDYTLFYIGNNSTWRYHIKSDGIYNLHVIWEGYITGTHDNVNFYIKSAQKGTLAIYTKAGGVSASFSGSDNISVYLKAGDSVYLWVETTVTSGHAYTVKIYGTDSGMGKQTNLDVVTADITDTAFGWHVPCAINLPDIQQKDFLKAIAQMLGIIFSTNNVTKDVVFTALRDIIANKVNALDWSAKLDLSKEIDITFRIGSYAQTNLLKYKESEGPENGIGDSSFAIADEILELEKTLINLIFETSETKLVCYQEEAAYIPNQEDRLHILSNRDDAGKFHSYDKENWTAFALSMAGDKVPWYDADSLGVGSKKEPPAILRDTGWKILRCEIIAPTGTKRFYESDTTSYTSVTTSLPVAYFIHTVSDSLDWASLRDEFYDGLINMLNKCKVVKAYFNLSAKDIVNVDFSKPVWVEKFQAMFYINKIENFSQGSTLVQLIKL